jgi:hypothetical protein
MRMTFKIVSSALIAIVALARFATADDFRVESKIYSGDSDRPVSDSLTLFHEGRAYDLLSSPPEITIFDLAQSRIVLLDTTRRIRTEVTTSLLTSFVDQLRVRASRQADPILKFMAEPKFTESVEKDGQLSFSSPHITYRVRGNRASNPAVVQGYREFADWTAQLTTLIRQGGQPPFPRLAVNASLERRGWLPDEVERTINDPNRPRGKPAVMRSTHKFETKLYSADLKRIEEADGYATEFKLVDIKQYLRPAEQAKR